jgi:magnesium chelatase family protein
MMDRIDLHVEVTPVTFDELTIQRTTEDSVSIRNRVIQARDIQQQRYIDDEGVHCNAQMQPRHIKNFGGLDSTCKTLLKTAMERLDLSARAYDRILKVSRTIADLDGSEKIQQQHLAEAIQYRSLDRGSWAG